MSEEERFLIATIVGILIGISTEPEIGKDLNFACAKAKFSPEYLASVLDELES